MSLKHVTMTLYSDPLEINSHRTRITLAEKGTQVDIVYIDDSHPLPEKLSHLLNKENLPILVDRDLILYEPIIIAEYLDERFPHPPLLPVYPVLKAKCRLLIRHFEQIVYPVAKQLEDTSIKSKEPLIKVLSLYLEELIEVLDDGPYLMGESFSLADCCLIPLLCRLKNYNLPFKKNWDTLGSYVKTVFNRPSFQESLSDLEKEMVYEYDLF